MTDKTSKQTKSTFHTEITISFTRNSKEEAQKDRARYEDSILSVLELPFRTDEIQITSEIAEWV